MDEPESHSQATWGQWGPINAKFGLHFQHFATLPQLSDFEAIEAYLHDHHQSWLVLDLKPVLAQFEKGATVLEVSVPTLGFSDPAFDVEVRPLFALPMMINGALGRSAQGTDKLIDVQITDISGQRYPLLFDEQGQIDYSKIQNALAPGQQVFTTLKTIHYQFSKALLLEHLGLVKWELAPSQEPQIIFEPPFHFSQPFSMNLRTLDHQGNPLSEHQQWFDPPNPLSSIHEQGFELQCHHEGGQGELKLDSAFKVEPWDKGFRHQVLIEIPKTPGQDIQVSHGNAPQYALDQDSEYFRFIQYHGLSESTLTQLVTTLLPKENILNAQTFSSLHSDPNASVFNAFKDHPQALSTLHDLVIQGVIEQTLPLFALKPMFADPQEILSQFQQWDLNTLDPHDHSVLSTWLGPLTETMDETFYAQVIDDLDEWLSMGPEQLEIQFHATLQGGEDPLHHQDLRLELHSQPWSSPQGLTPTLTLEGNTQSHHIIEHQLLPSDSNPFSFDPESDAEMLLSDAPLTPSSSTGQWHAVHLPSALEGIDIIEDFNFANNDKLDLSALFYEIEKSGDILTDVKLHTTQSGDTEVLVEKSSEQGDTQTLHVATLVGVSPENGDLPLDPHSFIELPH